MFKQRWHPHQPTVSIRLSDQTAAGQRIEQDLTQLRWGQGDIYVTTCMVNSPPINQLCWNTFIKMHPRKCTISHLHRDGNCDCCDYFEVSVWKHTSWKPKLEWGTEEKRSSLTEQGRGSPWAVSLLFDALTEPGLGGGLGRKLGETFVARLQHILQAARACCSHTSLAPIPKGGCECFS